MVVTLLDREEQDGRARVAKLCEEVGAEFHAVFTKTELDQVREEIASIRARRA